MLYRARSFEAMGFTGFEGRHYSLFESLSGDMGCATNLQMLITALAYKYIVTGQVSHADIPDHPVVESERRQVFFGAAVGIPTFYVDSKTSNRFLTGIIKQTANTRHSRRYSGCTRVRVTDFRRALLNRLREDAPDLIEMGGLGETLRDLAARIDIGSGHAVSDRLAARICHNAGVSSPWALTGEQFNAAAETLYRDRLKRDHMGEALDSWAQRLRQLDGMSTGREGYYNQALFSILGGSRISAYQIMSLLSIPYGLLVPYLLPSPVHQIDLLAGLRLLWNPALIVFLQLAGVSMFVHTGRSRVTGSGLSFHVRQGRI